MKRTNHEGIKQHSDSFSSFLNGKRMLYLFGQKFTNREVADILLRSVHTVATYRSRILRTFQTDDIQVVYKLAASLGGFHFMRISDLFYHKKKSIN